MRYNAVCCWTPQVKEGQSYRICKNSPNYIQKCRKLRVVDRHGETFLSRASSAIVSPKAAMEPPHIALRYDQKTGSVRHVKAAGDVAKEVVRLDQ